MAVKIRLARRGRKKLALYDIVIADERAPRDGRFIEKLGNYNPNTHPASINLKADATITWLLNGAQPTNTVRNILSKQGILLRKHLQVGVNKGAITQEEADKRWNAWQEEKQSKLNKKVKPATPAKPAPKKSEPAQVKAEEKPVEQVQHVQASAENVQPATETEATTQESPVTTEENQENK